MKADVLIVFLFSIFLSGHHLLSEELPLSTDSRWIVDEGGHRVKLACVNWPSHLEVVLAEGLGKQPLDAISKKIASLGFNCVRLTWPLFLVTDERLGNSTVRANLEALGLNESIGGIAVNNPMLLDLPAVKAYQAVVSNLGSNNIMVILDNHISKPGWCCGNTDGNGFFGDRFFDPESWIEGLAKMATIFSSAPNVVGMSLRNELRGPRQNSCDWFRYMTRGAEAVHAANPNCLVILSGLSFDTDLGFLRSRQVNLTFSKKLVFEFHWYSFSDGSAWLDGNPNQVCGRVVGSVMSRAGFLLDEGFPLFLSEFGVDQRGTNVADNRYISCALATIAELDIDWALWALQGSYYLREGVLGLDEVYGALGWDWCKARNNTFVARISSIQSPLRGPGFFDVAPYKMIFHPATGLCILRNSLERLALGACRGSGSWNYTSGRNIQLNGSLCLTATGVGKPALLGNSCSMTEAQWDMISDSKMHVSTKLPNGGGAVCLDIDGSGTLVTNPCKCLAGDKSCEAADQWFKMVTSTRNVLGNKPLIQSFPSEEDVATL